MSDARWYQWPTMLSLDAPLVAVAWQYVLARVGQVRLGWVPVFVLGASVWLAYAADRWIEGWRLDEQDVRTQRHLFYRRQRWTVTAVWLAIFAADLYAAFTQLPAADLARGFVLAGAVGMYLLSHQLVHRDSRWRVPKELIVAGLLTAGAVLFLVGAPASNDLPMPASLFALLCFTNCALISIWERDIDLAHGQTSLATAGAVSDALIRQLPWVIAAIAIVMAAISTGAARMADLAAMAASLLLAAVDRAEPRIGRRAARVLVDSALLAPALAVLVVS